MSRVGGRYQSFPSVGACYDALFPDAQRLYVSPDITTSAANNPYLRLLYRDTMSHAVGEPISLSAAFPLRPLRDRRAGIQGVWHQHWLQCSSIATFLRAAHRLRAARRYRELGGHVLWTVHNLEPHVRRMARANAWLTSGMRDAASSLHVHTEEAADALRTAWGVSADRIVIIPHPSYDVVHVPREAARAQLRERYGIELGEARVFLVFGMMARYKQIVETIGAFEGLRADRVKMLVAGAVRGNESEYLDEIAAAAVRGPVEVCAQFIPDEHVPWFFGASDVALFNYRQILTSGAIQLARDYGKPIWMPDLPALSGVVGEHVTRFADTDALRELVAESASISAD